MAIHPLLSDLQCCKVIVRLSEAGEKLGGRCDGGGRVSSIGGGCLGEE
ncbi:hypothetical protein A2U01_0005899 [Trifolium medium]|uniref:Uncharacterized protein n=1 Tax=Trifolium medium TaxID=97028 RepID=A0A392MC11_9FABA|nr:hypothetical protein [Trifolium medium]